VLDGHDGRAAESQSSCDEIETKMQQQLETCLFARAELERQAVSAKQAAEPLPAGKQTVSETVEVPQIPEGYKNGYVLKKGDSKKPPVIVPHMEESRPSETGVQRGAAAGADEAASPAGQPAR